MRNRIRKTWLAALLAAGLALTACSGSAGEPSDTSAEDATAPAPAEALATTGTTWLYRDALAPGWNDWSWASRSLGNRRPVAAGRYSIAASFKAWQGLYFVHGGFSTAGHDAFTVRVHGGKSGTGAALQVRAMVGGALTSGIDLGRHCAAGRIVAGKWTTCTVPLTAVAPAGATITGLQIQEFRGGSIPTIYFDELGFRVAATAPTDPVSVGISPASVSLEAGQAQQFSASVANATDGRVTWSVEPSGAGTVDATGRYTAPATAGTYGVVATSVADPTRSAKATVTVTVTAPPPPPPPVDPISVAVSPTSITLDQAATTRFTATTNDTAGVRWSIREGSAGGSIDATGLYRAPDAAGTFRVVATSVSSGTVAAEAVVTVRSVGVSVSPLATTLEPGASRRFSATVSGSANGSVRWSVQESGGGTIDSTGLYTAPGGTGVFHVVATHAGDPTASASATVRVEAPTVVSVSVAPIAASLSPNGTQQFVATVTGASDPSVTWSVQEGSSGGTVDSMGRYTAPSAAGTYHVVARSNATGATAAATVTVSSPATSAIDMSILPADRRGTWNPGIPGGIPTQRQVFTTLSGLATNGTGDAAPTINQAIVNAHAAYLSSGTIQEVVLPAGTIRVAGTIVLGRSGVVLRGEGMTRTRLRYDGGGDAIRMGRNQWGSFGSAHGPFDLQADAMKGTRQIVLSNTDGQKVQVGDVLTIDQEDDLSYVRMGDARYEKRQPSADTHGPALRGTGLWRSVTSMIRIAGKSVGSSTTTFTLADPLHMDFRRSHYAQVFHTATEYSSARPQFEGVHYAGLEDLYFTGGPFKTNNVAFCWMKDVEVDGNPGTSHVGSYNNQAGISGRSVNLFHAYRFELRGSYIHHSRNISQGGGAYLLSISSYTSESLIEDNIIVFGNKLVVGNMMGGGNVIAYNYVDNARTSHSSWQEGAIDLNHQSFTHNALVEGNWATNLTSDTTHGNAGWHVFLRNHGTGQNSAPIYGAYPYLSAPDGQYRRAAGTDGYHREATYVGNVLKAGTGTGVYQVDTTTGSQINAAAVWRIGWGVNGGGDSGDDGTALRLLYRHGNWDSVSGGVVWDSGNSNRNLPVSFYRTSKPAFFGSNPWPWIEPTRATAGERVGILPAKARFDAMNR